MLKSHTPGLRTLGQKRIWEIITERKVAYCHKLVPVMGRGGINEIVMVFNFIINVSKSEAATVQNVMVDKLEIPKCLCFILSSVKSSTRGSSCSPYSSLRRWDLQRARCPNTVCASGTLLCEYSFSWCDSTQITLSQLFNLNIDYQLDLKQNLCFVSLCISRKSKGLSGRALRKLPFLAHALFVKVNISYSSMENPW